MSWLYFIMAVLATYRVAHMIAREDGPFDIFSRLRESVLQESWIGRGLNCILCISFWLALPVAFFTGLPWFLAWLGIAGGVMSLFILIEVK